MEPTTTTTEQLVDALVRDSTMVRGPLIKSEMRRRIDEVLSRNAYEERLELINEVRNLIRNYNKTKVSPLDYNLDFFLVDELQKIEKEDEEHYGTI